MSTCRAENALKNPTCKFDQRSIDKPVKELQLDVFLPQTQLSYYGKRRPQRTMNLDDPVSMSPAEARLAAETIKSQVRAGEGPGLPPEPSD